MAAIGGCSDSHAPCESGEIPPSPSQQQFCHLLKEYLKDHRMMAEILAELQGQLGSLLGEGTAAEAETPALLKRAQEKAPSARLDAYLQGRLPQAAPAGNLAVQLDQNLQLLQILGAEMRGLHLEMDTALQGHMEAEGLVEGEELAADSAGQALLMAATIDSLTKENGIVEKVVADVALDTPAERLSSYATTLQIEPYLDSAVLGGILAWGDAAAAATPPPSAPQLASDMQRLAV